MMPNQAKLVEQYLKKNIPDFRVGDTVTVSEKVKEGGKERAAKFTGLVIARKHGAGVNATFTVRAEVAGMGVERIFPLHSPLITKIKPVKRSKVRRAKLYYLRREVDRKRRRFEAVKHEFASSAEEAVKTGEVESPAQTSDNKEVATKPAKV